MAKFVVSVETLATPEQVRAALLDFTPARPDVWPGLAREFYEVYEIGDRTAVIREGSSKPSKVWARERYDWSKPGIIRWTVEESNFCNPGSYVEARIAPSDTGSHVEVEWNRTGSTRSGKMMVAFMKVAGPKIIGSYMRKTLDGLARASNAA